jgi:hypothetical protein
LGALPGWADRVAAGWQLQANLYRANRLAHGFRATSSLPAIVHDIVLPKLGKNHIEDIFNTASGVQHWWPRSNWTELPARSRLR